MAGGDERLAEVVGAALPEPAVLIPRLAKLMGGAEADAALLALSDSILRYPDTVTESIRDHLAVFVKSVLESRLCLSPGLAGLLEAVCRIGILPELPTGVSLLSCEPPRRRSLLTALHTALPDSVSTTLLSSLLCLIEGETDPAALLAAFRLIADALDRVGAALSPVEAEAAFDQCCVYFPITYTGPACPGATLRSLLLRCLTSRPELAPYALPFFLDKLHSALSQAQLQSLIALGQCMTVFPVADLLPYCPELRSYLTQIWAEPATPSATLSASLDALSHSVSRLSSNDEFSARFLDPILETIAETIRVSVRVRRGPIYGQVLSVIGSESPRRVYDHIWPILAPRISDFGDAVEGAACLRFTAEAFADFNEEIIDAVFTCANRQDLVVFALPILCRSIPHFDDFCRNRLITLSASLLADKPVSLSALQCLVRLCDFSISAVVQATFPSITESPEQMEYMCIKSGEYLSRILPGLAGLRGGNPAISASLCKIARNCPADRLPDLITILDSNDDFFEAVFIRASSADQESLISSNLTNNYLDDRRTKICILGRRPETILSDEKAIFQVAFNAAEKGDDVACLVVADILNKSSEEFISRFLHSEEYRRLDWLSSTMSLLLVLISRALASRGIPHGFQMAEKICVSGVHSEKLPFFVHEDFGAQSWNVLPLYKQRMLGTVIPIVLASDKVDSLADLFGGAPRQVLVDFTLVLLPLLARTLATSPSSLSALLVLIQSNPACVPLDLLPALSVLVRAPSARTRSQALLALSLLLEHRPRQETFPYHPIVRTALLGALDDPKRVCRAQARSCLRCLE